MSSYQYTGKPITPDFVLNMAGKELKNGIDYDVKFTDNINAGTATAEITGKGEFTGTVKRTFTIQPVTAKQLEFYAEATVFEYDDKPKTLNLLIKYGEIVLSEGRDYEIEYSDNINVGNASARIRFTGNYVGTTKIMFRIEGFENTSEISENEIYLGKSVKINASCVGGRPPYKYAYFVRYADKKSWSVISDFSRESEISYSPEDISDYIICVKIADSTHNMVKKYIPFSVITNIDFNCRLSNDRIKLNGRVNISVDVTRGRAPFKYSYYTRRYGEQKYEFIDKQTDSSNAVFMPKKTGLYDVWVKIEDADRCCSKRSFKVTVHE